MTLILYYHLLLKNTQLIEIHMNIYYLSSNGNLCVCGEGFLRRVRYLNKIITLHTHKIHHNSLDFI